MMFLLVYTIIGSPIGSPGQRSVEKSCTYTARDPNASLHDVTGV